MNSPSWWSNLHPGSMAAFLLAAVVVVFIGVLTLQHDTVPAILDNVLYILLGTGGSIAIVSTAANTTATVPPVVPPVVSSIPVPTPVATEVPPTVVQSVVPTPVAPVVPNIN